MAGSSLSNVSLTLMKTKIIGIGAGGHAKVVIDVLRMRGEYDLIGLIDTNRQLHGRTVNGVPVLGDDMMLERLRGEGILHVFIGIGGVSDMSMRRDVYDRATAMGFSVAGVVHPRAWVSPSAMLNHGVHVMAGAVINADARIGENVIVNTGAIVEHDCIIGSNVHIASLAVISGGVVIGSAAFVGAGAAVKHSIRIGDRAVVGTGAAVIRDVPEGVVVAGVPACQIRKV